MKKGWRIFTIVAGIVVLMAASFLYWSTWEGSTEEIESVANEFKPNSDWEQVSSRVNSPQNICFDVRCPSVHKSWKTPQIISKNVLRETLTKSGWNFEIQGDCQADPRFGGSGVSVCAAQGEVGVYRVKVDVVGNYNDSSVSRVVLYIEESNK